MDKINMMYSPQCVFGCGNIATDILKSGNWCCNKFPMSCPEVKKSKIGENNSSKQPEIRKKIGDSCRGKKRDPKASKRAADKNRGRKQTEEAKKKISEKAKGRKLKLHQIQRMINNNPMKNPKTVEKMASKKKGQKHTEETKNNLSIYMTKLFSSEKYKKIFSEKSKNNFTNPEYLKKLQKSTHIKPNKPETIILNILNELGLNYIYTGDYSFWIDRRNPDFIDNKAKKVIEFFGGWYHSERYRKNKSDYTSDIQHEQEKIEHYRKNKYYCLVIWQKDLKDIKSLITKILKFEGDNNDFNTSQI